MFEIITVLILLLVLCIIKIISYDREKILLKNICFCCAKNSDIHRCNLSLFSHIFNIQNDLRKEKKIKQKYCITQNDSKYANEILKKFSDNLLQSYLDKELDVGIKKTVSLSKEEFLMIYLWNFLRNNNNFIFEKMYSYGKIPDGERYRELHLTDFSLVYYKLLYITQLYCHSSNNIMKQFPRLSYENIEGTTEIIDSKVKKHYIN